MTRRTARRDELAQAATDVVLAEGLIGLSLRPLAASLGTSDRMLLYHFDDKDDLVATVLRTSIDRALSEVAALPPAGDVASAVHALWAAHLDGPLERCQRLYVEAATLGLLGREPYAGVVREANRRWEVTLAAYLVASGCPEDRSARAVYLTDAAFMGFQLDLPLYRDTEPQRQAVDDLAVAVAAIAGA